MARTKDYSFDEDYVPPPNWGDLEEHLAPRQIRKADPEDAVNRTGKGDRENTTIIHKRKHK